MRALAVSMLVAALGGAAGCGLEERRLGNAPAPCTGDDCAVEEPPPAAPSGGGSGGAGTGGSGAATAGVEPGAGETVDDEGTPELSGSGGSPVSGEGAGEGGEPSSAPGEGSGSPCANELLQNGGFEDGATPWAEFYPGEDPIIYAESESASQGTLAKSGAYLAWFGGVAEETTRLSQTVRVPEGTLALVVSGHRRFISREPLATPFVDRMTIRLLRGLEPVLELEQWGNQDTSQDPEWQPFSRSIPAADYIGQELTLQLESNMGPAPDSNFFFDDLSLIAECTP